MKKNKKLLIIIVGLVFLLTGCTKGDCMGKKYCKCCGAEVNDSRFLSYKGLSCSVTRGIFVPCPGIKPTTSALEGRFLTTGPPEVPKERFLN